MGKRKTRTEIFFSNPEVIRKYIKKDVDLIFLSARVVIVIDEDGNTKMVWHNDRWDLNIIAVIGPGSLMGMNFSEAVLFEIGIGATRPYHDARVHRNSCSGSGKKWLHKRGKWFCLGKDQYVKIRPAILGLIKEFAEKTIRSWRNKTFTLKVEKSYISRRYKKIQERSSFIECLTGARFSASYRDDFFVRDIIQLELNNPVIKEKLEKLARFFNICLSCNPGEYKQDYYSNRRMERLILANNTGIAEAYRTLCRSKFQSHQLEFIKQRVSRKALLENVIKFWAKKQGVQIGNGLEVKIKHDNIDAFGMRVRTISENEKKRDHLVFEVAIPELVEKEQVSTPF